MGFTEQEQLLSNDALMGRVRIAIVRIATMVLGEALGTGAKATERRDKRHALGLAVINDPDRYAIRFGRAIFSQGTMVAENLQGTITTASTDEDIETQVSAVWSDVAGVTVEEAQT